METIQVRFYPNQQTNLNKNNRYSSSKTQYLHLKIGKQKREEPLDKDKKILWE